MYTYIRASLTSGLVGIWWITSDNQVIAEAVPLDSGYNDGNYIQYHELRNHATEWRRLITETFPDNYEDYLKLGYKGLERGRVIYNLRTQCYEIICSEAVKHNPSQRRAIAEVFCLTNTRCDFVALQHYYLAPLTGNHALDEMEYGI